jgi:GT2 family glycosyltransferase
MVDKDLYDEVGGLDEGYIIGDVEDSDFCLKLRARGSGSYYAPSVELYHLELRAQNLEGSTDWRASLNLHNAWRMTLRWSDEIQRLSRGHR